MKPGRLNIVNILLMLVIVPVAYFFPFGLFLFSYAVFGPLHYLTEISWLKKRNFYTHMKTDALVFGGLCLVITLLNTFIGDDRLYVVNVLFITAFFGALMFTLVKTRKARVYALVLTIITALAAGTNRTSFIIFTVLLPTIVHVFIFTALFMLYGALKSRSRTGYMSVAALVGCIVFLLWGGGTAGHNPGEYVRAAYASFENVNFQMMSITNIREPDIRKAIYDSPAGISIMRFIAFVYTYHYLNWFSKTSIIGWHKTSKRNLAVILGLWITIVGIYVASYKLGLLVLYFFSLLHVFLEYPLNHQTIIGIGKELKGRLNLSFLQASRSGR